MIGIAEPEIGPEEIGAVNEVLKSGMLAQGPKVSALEEAFAKACGTKYAVAANSGTAALHMAVQAAGVEAGDEVITVPFTFIATVNTILMQRGRPVFVDIETDSFNMDVSKVESAITNKTKAILPVDLYGQPYDYDGLKAIADKHNLKIIEDACQAVGAEFSGRKAGSLGDMGCFSLYATKNVISGEGGIITTDDEDFVKRMKSFRQHGMDMDGNYGYRELGYNYRMTDLQAAIAIEQLKKADNFSRSRNHHAQVLTKGLNDIPGIITPATKPGRSHVYHQYTIRITDDFGLSRDEVAKKLREAGIGAGVYYPKPLHAYQHIAALGYKMGDFPVAERAAEQVISLPVHPKVGDEDLQRIISTLREMASDK